MAERKPLTTRRSKSAGAGDSPRHVEAAMRDVQEGVKPKRVPYDTHPDTHRKLSSMRVMSSDNVPVKNFLDEAVQDLFEKYRRGEGRYKVKDVDRILSDD